MNRLAPAQLCSSFGVRENSTGKQGEKSIGDFSFRVLVSASVNELSFLLAL